MRSLLSQALREPITMRAEWKESHLWWWVAEAALVLGTALWGFNVIRRGAPDSY